MGWKADYDVAVDREQSQGVTATQTCRYTTRPFLQTNQSLLSIISYPHLDPHGIKPVVLMLEAAK